MVGSSLKPSCGRHVTPIHSIPYSVAHLWREVYKYYSYIIRGSGLVLLHTVAPLSKRLPLIPRGALIVDKPLVCQRICPTACKSNDLRPAVGTGMHFYVSHRPTLRLRGVPCLRTSCARHFSPSGLHLFASVCSAKNARNDVHAVISD